MLSFRAFCLFFLVTVANAVYGPELRVHKGELDIHTLGKYPHEYITHYEIGEMYTFEVFLDETTQHDYMVKQCFMNGEQIIGEYGCVECGNCVSRSVETESYNKPGAIKRTMITFPAQETTIKFACVIDKLECSGCAERSCQRRDQIALSHFNHQQVTLMYPPPNYPIGPGAYPLSPNIYPTPPFGGYAVPPHAPPVVPPPIPPPNPGGVSSYGGATGVWPWWIWLLILLLLLLLLCCLLALCLAAFLKRRREKKAAAVVVTDGKDCAVGTDRVSVTCVGTDTQDIVKIQPAMILGAQDLERHHHHQQNQYSRSQAEYDQGSVMAGGSYSLKEGMVHEGYTRTLPRESYSTADRYASRDRFERQMNQSQDNGRFTDRSSYRNFAYERDMGRVEPMDGYDEVETRERTYCLSDDDQEVVEKNITRTHTTRYVTESREYEQDNEECMRGDEYHHAPYTHSLPV